MKISNTTRYWILAAALLLPGCVTRTSSDAARNQAIIRRYFERWANLGDAAVADELIATDLVLHNPPVTLRSLEEYKASMAGFHGAFPDLHFTVEDEIADGDRVAVRWTMRGTLLGQFRSFPPNGKAITVSGISLFRLAGGRIQEIWVNMDRAGMMDQLGVTAASNPPAK